VVDSIHYTDACVATSDLHFNCFSRHRAAVSWLTGAEVSPKSANEMSAKRHLRHGSAWALLLGLLLLVILTAFSAGRAFNSSNSSYGARQQASESKIWSKISSHRLYGVKYANSSATEHPACAFFRSGEMRCSIVQAS
jgi:hypothetical protein